MPCSLTRAGVAQLVEYELPKLGVAGSNPVARSSPLRGNPGTRHRPRRRNHGNLRKARRQAAEPPSATAATRRPHPPAAPAARRPRAGPGSRPRAVSPTLRDRGQDRRSRARSPATRTSSSRAPSRARSASRRDLRVGQGGVVKATVAAAVGHRERRAAGRLRGPDRVEIQATGRLTGNIRAPKIVIAEGAMFRGNSDMSGRKDDRRAANSSSRSEGARDTAWPRPARGPVRADDRARASTATTSAGAGCPPPPAGRPRTATPPTTTT